MPIEVGVRFLALLLIPDKKKKPVGYVRLRYKTD